MWLRLITKIGNSKHIVLPTMALRSLGWDRGDWLQVSVVGANKILLEKLELARLTDESIRIAIDNSINKNG